MANEVLDWLRMCPGEEGEGERGEGEAENMAGLGLPTPPEAGEAEAFRANGLLRTDMAWFSRHSALGTNHGREMGDNLGDVVGVCLSACDLAGNQFLGRLKPASNQAKTPSTQKGTRHKWRTGRQATDRTEEEGNSNINKRKRKQISQR